MSKLDVRKMTDSRREMLFCAYSYCRREDILKSEDLSKLEGDHLDEVIKLDLTANVYWIIMNDLIEIKDIPSVMKADIYAQTVYAELMDSELNRNLVNVAKCEDYIKGIIEDESDYIYYADDYVIYDFLIWHKIEPWYSKEYVTLF